MNNRKIYIWLAQEHWDQTLPETEITQSIANFKGIHEKLIRLIFTHHKNGRKLSKTNSAILRKNSSSWTVRISKAIQTAQFNDFSQLYSMNKVNIECILKMSYFPLLRVSNPKTKPCDIF